jgi:hypothetical protein
MFTLRLSVLGLQGEPVPFGFLAVINVDDPRKFVGFPIAVNGDARISVPAGHYAVLLDYPTFDAAGNFVAERVAITEFDVTGARTATVDARTASSRISIRTPRPANLVDTNVVWFRGPDDVSGFSIGIDTGTEPMFVSPTPPVTTGVQHYYAAGVLQSPAGAPTPYDYRVEFPSDGAIGANQRYVAAADSLATVDTAFFADMPMQTGVATFGFLPWEFVAGAPLLSFPTPQRRTQYLTARPDLAYDRFVVASLNDFGGVMFDAPRTYPRRQRVAEEWFRQPLAPGFQADLGVGTLFCNACRNGDLMSVFVTPVTDSMADHGGFLDSPGTPGVTSTSRFRLLSGSTVIADGTDVAGGDFTVPAASAPYKIVYDQTRVVPWSTLSPTSHTEWTFTSAHSATNTMPDRFLCDGEDQACSAMPLVTLNYRLGTRLTGSMPPGPATLQVTVGHTPGAPALPIRSAAVSVSFDNGRTWTPVSMRDLGAGRFRASWTNPASVSGGPVSLRVSATDTAGGTVAQTVTRAFVITPGGSGA